MPCVAKSDMKEVWEQYHNLTVITEYSCSTRTYTPKTQKQKRVLKDGLVYEEVSSPGCSA